MDLMIIGYPERLVADHAALLEAATRAGFSSELVAPSRLSLLIDHHGAQVLVDGVERQPQVVLPRGVNRPWPLLRQILELWQHQGVVVVPGVDAADLCADKVATTKVLADAGVPVLATTAIIPGSGVVVQTRLADGPVVVKPGRASKARGVTSFASVTDAQHSLREGRTLVEEMVDHQVVQPRADTAGCDYRVVVARGTAVAVTRRTAPQGEFVTNRPDAVVTDVTAPEVEVPEVVEVALQAAEALGLAFGGIDVIMHQAKAVVLEANAWPGLAAHIRSDQLARALVDVALSLIQQR